MIPDYVRKHNRDSIVRIDLYANDVVIKRRNKGNARLEPKRSEIMEFTEKSRKRLAFVAANSSVYFSTMITLTYPAKWPKDGRAVKRDLQTFIKRLQRLTDCSYLWFIEFQRRGAPHFHLLLDIEAKTIERGWVSQSWYEIVGSEDPKHLKAGTRIEAMRKNGAYYAVKYAYKMEQKIVPIDYQNIGRFWGYSRDVKPEPIVTVNSGDIREIMVGIDGWQALIESGYSTLFGLSSRVAINLAKVKPTQ